MVSASATVQPQSEVDVRGVPLQLVEIGSGPPLLWLHGLHGPDSPEAAAIARLSESFRVLLPTHPGFALSPRESWFNSVEDLAYLYLDLLEQQDLRDVCLVGSSLGGWVAAEMAVRSQDRIAVLALADAVGIKVGDCWTRDIADIFALDAAEVARRTFAVPPAAPDINALTDDQLLARVRTAEATAVYGWEPYMYSIKLRRQLGRIAVPTLLLWGADDGVVTVDYGRAFAAEIPGAELAVIENAGHYPHLEQADAFVQRLESFLAAQVATSR